MTPLQLQQARQSAVTATARNNAEARNAAIAWRSRGGASKIFGDFGASFGSDFGAENLWIRIKRFFGFKIDASTQIPELAALNATEEVFAPPPHPLESMQVDEVMNLEGAQDHLTDVINVHAAALPAKVAAVQANPTQANINAAKITALKLQGQQLLLTVPTLPAMQQAMVRAQAQALLAEAAGLEAARR